MPISLIPFEKDIGCIHWEPTWKLNTIFFEYCFVNLSKPIASEVIAPNFLDKSILACSLETVILTNNSKSFALLVDSIIFISSSLVSKEKVLTLYLKYASFMSSLLFTVFI